jgi:hypothetical protein
MGESMPERSAASDRRRALRLVTASLLIAIAAAGCGKLHLPKMHMPNWLWWKKPPPALPLVEELIIASDNPTAAGDKFEQRRDYQTLVLDVYSGGAGAITMTRRDPDRPWPFHFVLRFHLSTVAVLDVTGDQRLHMSPGTPNKDGLVVVEIPTHIYSNTTGKLRLQWSPEGPPPPQQDSPAQP